MINKYSQRISRRMRKEMVAENIEHQFIFKLNDNRPWWMPEWVLDKFINAVYAKEDENKKIREQVQ